MPFIQLIILALIQGITEFLPISSSAHLIVAPILVDGWADQGPILDVAAHVGSLFAVLLYFRSDSARLIRGGVNTLFHKTQGSAGEDRKLFLFMLAASIPFLIVGAIVALSGLIDNLRSAMVIGISSIVFGTLLWHGDRPRGQQAPIDTESPSSLPSVETLTWRHAMMIGFAQILAIIPGASRSGVTMTAARYLGWSRPEAARFSMLLAIPTIAALGLLAGLDMFTGQVATADPISASIVAVLSFLAAYIAINVLMKLIQSMSFTPFVIYRLVFGVFLIIFSLNFQT